MYYENAFVDKHVNIRGSSSLDVKDLQPRRQLHKRI